MSRAAIIAFATISGLASFAWADPDEAPTTAAPPAEILQEAFDRVLNYPSVRSITFRIQRDGKTRTTRTFDTIYKRFEGKGRTLLRFTEPEYMRGIGLLILDEGRGSNLVWIYQPEFRKPRRIHQGQKADPFYGSDFTIEDFEHHDWRTYDVQLRPDSHEQGRSCFVLDARPLGESQYSHVVAWVEKDRRALLRVDFFLPGQQEAVKSLVVEADEMTEQEGWLVPRRMWMRRHGRDAATEAVLDRIRVDPVITERLFSISLLEHMGSDLFDLVESEGHGAAK